MSGNPNIRAHQDRSDSDKSVWRTGAVILGLIISLACGCSDPSTSGESGVDADKGAVGRTDAGNNVPTKAELSRAQRQRVWDIEHLAFLMEAEVFPVIKAAIREGDLSTVQHLFDSSCDVQLPAIDTAEQFAHGEIIVRQINEGAAAGQGDLTDWFRQIRRMFEADNDPGVSLGLVRLGPESMNGSLDGPWKSEWKLQVSGMRAGRPIDLLARIKLHFRQVTEEIAQQQHWITEFHVASVKITESPRVLFEETTAATGLPVESMRDNWRPECRDDFQTRTGGIYASDYNRDGAIDFLIDDIELGRRLYRGRGDGTFEDVTAPAGLAHEEPLLWTGAVWLDVDGDGYEDLISESQLFRNQHDGTFQDMTEHSNLRLTPTAGYAVADFDLDGQVDLYVCHSGPYLPGQTAKDAVPWIDGALGVDNVLWQNLGDWQFRDVTHTLNAGAEGVTSFAAVWTDANGDLRPDLLAINEFGRNSFLLNGVDGFRTPSFEEVFGGFSMGVSAGDIDNDGDLDVYVANMYSKAGNRIITNIDPESYEGDLYNKLVEATLGSKLYLNDGQGNLMPQDTQPGLSNVGWAYGPAMGDFDADGLLDIYATAGFRSVERGKPDG